MTHTKEPPQFPGRFTARKKHRIGYMPPPRMPHHKITVGQLRHYFSIKHTLPATQLHLGSNCTTQCYVFRSST